MQSKLDRLKSKLQGRDNQITINTEIYLLAKELGCLPDLLGREYEVVYEGDKIKRIIQKPISIPSFINLMEEMRSDYKRQEQEMKKANKGRGRR